MEMIKEIPLQKIHESLQAKMMPFAGYNMPVRYSSDKEEHMAVRNTVGVFDVSHMGEFIIKGEGALDLIQKVSANDASKLSIGQAQYTYLPNANGGIVDDFLVYKMEEDVYLLVVNASNIEKDWNWIQSHNSFGATMEDISDDTALFAVQGPKAEETLQKLTNINLSEISFYHFTQGKMAGLEDVTISATGYTGAGGFELYVHKDAATSLWKAIFEAGEEFGILPIGLGARDTLRLEMGYCLYGNDIDDQTCPIEAGLSWVTRFNKDFINAESLKQRKENGVSRKLTGFKLDEKGIPRKGYTICDADGNPIGEVTSGSLSPSLNQGIGLGYIQSPYHKSGEKVYIQVRKKLIPATVQRPPFIKK